MQKTNQLGCLTGTGIAALLITASIIAAYVFFTGGLLFNPGPLNAKTGQTLGGVTSHAGTNGNCKACHTAPWESATMADRCMACHGGISVQLKDLSSMHGILMHDNPKLKCRHCHAEHRGPDALLTIVNGVDFPHQTVGFSLAAHYKTSANLPFTCDDCHHGDITTFAPDTCQTCHTQIDSNFALAHAYAYGTACLQCHDGMDRFSRPFKHNFSFQLTGSHSSLDCSKCHANAHTLTDFSAIAADCNSCHKQDEPHAGRFGTDCAACHSTDAWKPAKFDHNLASFKLTDAHTTVKCEACHTTSDFKNTPTDCYSCHKKDDRHKGQFGTECSACHQPTNWKDTTFDHSKSNFPLTGAHTSVPCENCHKNNTFKGLDPSCASCHGDPGWHQGAFGLNCATCHTTLSWANAKFSGSHPSFGEEGGIRHGGASCKTCHTVNVYKATCTACHKNGNPGDGGGGGNQGGGGD